MHELSASFVLGYHGCDVEVAEKLLNNHPFRPSHNLYDWLGEGIYFWEANPLRGLEFAREMSRRKSAQIKKPTVVGAVIDLGYCLDLTTSRGLRAVKNAYDELKSISNKAGKPLPQNQPSRFKHDLDCAVINYLHRIQSENKRPAFDSVKGIFIEPPQLYLGSEFYEKNHIQIDIRSMTCIKGVFRVPDRDLALGN